MLHGKHEAIVANYVGAPTLRKLLTMDDRLTDAAAEYEALRESGRQMGKLRDWIMAQSWFDPVRMVGRMVGDVAIEELGRLRAENAELARCLDGAVDCAREKLRLRAEIAEYRLMLIDRGWNPPKRTPDSAEPAND